MRVGTNACGFSVKKRVNEIKFTPSVIEPSFGIGRILYALLEHSFYVPPDNKEAVVMRFNPAVAPVKCAVMNLQSNAEFLPVVRQIATSLTAAGVGITLTQANTVILTDLWWNLPIE